METNINAIKLVDKMLLNIPVTPIYDILCNHPFFSSMSYIRPNMKGVYDLNDEEQLKLATNDISAYVDKLTKTIELYMLIRDPYKLLWMHLCEDYLSEKEFAEYLAESWVIEDNPNMDVNVSRKEAIRMFKKADKKYLMTNEDFSYYENLPDKLTIWRGVSPGRIKLGLSWTDDLDKATWFMHRFEKENGKKGKMYEAHVDKKHIIAYLNTRGEAELVTDVFKIRNDIHEIQF